LRGELNLGGKMKVTVEEIKEMEEYHKEVRERIKNDLRFYLEIMFERQEKNNESLLARIVVPTGEIIDECYVYVGPYGRRYREAYADEDSMTMWVAESDEIHMKDVVPL
jgi:hypothetical protein